MRGCHLILLAGLLPIIAGRPTAGAGHLWSWHPADYPRINRVQARGGVVTYSVDFSVLGLLPEQNMPAWQVAELEAAAVRAFDKWNEILEPLGLRFERRGVGQRVDIPVFAFRYEEYVPSELLGDTVAASSAFPLNGVMNFSTIVVDATEPFEVLDALPTVIDGGLHHPYVRYVDFDGVCMFTTILHEIGHQFGLGHPQDMFGEGRNFGFLALDTVQIDPGCMRPSDFMSGENLQRRGRFLASEIDSLMGPLQIGATVVEIPPEDRAFVAFVLREVDPEGADEMLARARGLFEQTNPFRFANVVPEHESVPGVREGNDSFDTAIPVEAGQIVLGSLTPETRELRSKDQDYYSLAVGAGQEGEVWIFDIDGGGGLNGANWVDAVLELYDERQVLLAVSAGAEAADPGSFSVVDPYLVWTPQEPGRYFLRLVAEPGVGEPGWTGDYELRIGIGEVPEPQGQAAPFADPSVEACEFQPLAARPLLPGTCGLFSLTSLGMAVLSMLALRTRLWTGRSRNT
ncbi:MAG: matrixin family metalloprotease [Phycisphaerales bacterium]|nr:MAG: matrixin family metalloprotease [Phycisphaerales bacterium]